jgi:hypothetical protein
MREWPLTGGEKFRQGEIFRLPLRGWVVIIPGGCAADPSWRLARDVNAVAARGNGRTILRVFPTCGSREFERGGLT